VRMVSLADCALKAVYQADYAHYQADYARMSADQVARMVVYWAKQ